MENAEHTPLRVGSDQLELLERLCNAVAVSGDEREVRAIVLEEIQPFADEVRVDALGNVLAVRHALQALNPRATLVEGASPLAVEDPAAIQGRRVLVIEDGPTLTHGEMAYGAAWVAARRFGAAEIVDPRPYAVGSIAEAYRKYPTTGDVLPAMGYGEAQIRELEQTIRNAPVDLVLIGTPIDLRRVLTLDKPAQRVRYELQEIGQPTLADILKQKFGPKA